MSDYDMIDAEVWYNAKTGEVVIEGDPDAVENHNCDEMGCGQYHVLFRFHSPIGHGASGDAE